MLDPIVRAAAHSSPAILDAPIQRDQSRVRVNARFVDAEGSRRPLQLAGRRVRPLPDLLPPFGER
jgi:TolB-like protein